MIKLLLLAFFFASPLRAAQAPADTGFLVLAPDRGFLGNAELRDAFDGYRKDFNAALVFVGAGDNAEPIAEAVAELKKTRAKEIVALPMFISGRQAGLLAAAAQIKPAIRVAPTMAESAFAAEILSDRLSSLSREPAREALVLVAQGAVDEAGAAEIEKDLLETAAGLPRRYAFATRRAVALSGWDPLRVAENPSWRRLRETLHELDRAGLKPVLVPFDFTTKMDSMMALSTSLRGLARETGAAFDGADLAPHPNLALWLSAESNRRLPATERTLGVVFMPHGADESWNRTMLKAVEPLTKRYMIEPAFSMADPVVIERAVRRLEARGARDILVLRVFSLEESFRAVTEHALGLRLEEPENPMAHSGHGMGGGHAGHGGGHHAHAAAPSEPTAPASPRILSGSVFDTRGGVEASPLFAEALLDRALELSEDPKTETVFLLAHGSGSDRENEHWRANLESLASQIKSLSSGRGAAFKDVRFGTWREDWPEKREGSIQSIREALGKAASEGKVLVVPARVGPGGPERELLAGLEFAYNGRGFAPHPKFAEWMEGQIQASLARFNARRAESFLSPAGSSPSR